MLTRWNPNRDLYSLADEMNRFVERVFSNGDTPETSLFKGTWTPAVDISEDGDNFYLEIELPGMDKDSVKVQYEEGLLTISGEKKTEREEKDVNYHRVERNYGKFERSFRVPSRILGDKVDANFSNGVLKVTLPKAEEVKPKQIDVKVK